MRKRIAFLLFLILIPSLAFAVGRSVFPTKNLVTFFTTPASIDPVNEVVNLPNAGSTDRVQMTQRDVNSCTFQAMASNTGGIYVGGPTVTNSIGVNEGIRLNPGEGFGPVAVTNSEMLFVSTDNSGNKVKMFCN